MKIQLGPDRVFQILVRAFQILAMKSVRISDDLFALARGEAVTMSRSIAQQLEHWGKLGAAVEQAGITQEQLRRILGGAVRVRERVFMKLGLLKQADLYLIPRAEARSFTLQPPSKRSFVRTRTTTGR
jgi:hypothetical protein